MLYSEFVENTGCRETDHNYKIYKELEIIYMNTDCTKEHIYEMGKKLVNNDKTEKELEIEAEVKEEIEACKRMIELYKKDIEWKNTCLAEQGDDKEWAKCLKSEIKYYKSQIRYQRNRINALKWVIG